jgi:hypothetical protein
MVKKPETRSGTPEDCFGVESVVSPNLPAVGPQEQSIL